MPRFVLLEHDHPFLHWDLMLECGDVLRTWRLDRIPAVAETIFAEPLPDHRLMYLDYEGPVSGNRGTVKQIDKGDFTPSCPDTDVADHKDVELQLVGTRLRGTARISNQNGTLEWKPLSPEDAV